MEKQSPTELVQEATYDFTMGENTNALEKIGQALELDPACFDAWLAKAEILVSARDYDEALQSAENARAINPDDVHVNTTLSRIWVERGDKEKAEYFGGRARMLGWKGELTPEA